MKFLETQMKLVGLQPQPIANVASYGPGMSNRSLRVRSPLRLRRLGLLTLFRHAVTDIARAHGEEPTRAPREGVEGGAESKFRDPFGFPYSVLRFF